MATNLLSVLDGMLREWLTSNPDFEAISDEIQDLLDGDIDDPKTSAKLREQRDKAIDLGLAKLKAENILAWLLLGKTFRKWVTELVDKVIAEMEAKAKEQPQPA